MKSPVHPRRRLRRVPRSMVWRPKSLPRARSSILLVAALALAFAALTPAPARAATFPVDSTGNGSDAALDGTCDDGAGNCTLRAAIEESNDSVAADMITFSLGASIIPVSGSPLPAITSPVTIDGTTAAGFSGSPIIRIDGATLAAGDDGLTISSGPTTIRALMVTSFPDDGIVLSAGSGHLIEGSFIGLQIDGETAAGNGGSGVSISADDTTVGGTATTAPGGECAGPCNVISTNGGSGIHVMAAAAGIRIAGNFIGTDVKGTSDRGNGADGIRIEGDDTVVGGTAGTDPSAGCTGDCNLISGNGIMGVRPLFGSAGVTIQGNFVGTDASGAADLGNFEAVHLAGGATEIVVGGTTPEARNLLSGSAFRGINLSASGAVVQGNFIGTDLMGADAGIGNGTDGIGVGGDDNLVGGTAPGSGNLIAFNSRDGVRVTTDGTANAVLGNAIHDNAALGVDLAGDGSTPNDGPGDPDAGPNDLQNFPVVDTVLQGSTIVAGSLDGEPSTNHRVEVFSNPPGGDEAQTFLGATEVATDPSGSASFVLQVGGNLAPGGNVTTTATKLDGSGAPGSTSEISATVALGALSCDGSAPAGGGTLVGGSGDDVLCGGPGNDTFVGGGGDDLFLGEGGVDTGDYSGNPTGITADLAAGTVEGASTDLLRSVEGVIGSPFADTLLGDAGDNTFVGGAGPDTFVGRGGTDTADYSARTEGLSLSLDGVANDGEAGEGDNLDVERVIGGSGDDTLSGKPGEDNTLDGGPGADTADYSANPTGVTADLAAGTVEGGSTDTLTGIEHLVGTPFGDVLRGDGGANTLDGRGGKDLLVGRGAADTLLGRGGPDTARGGGGKDLAKGGGGPDRLRGGGGPDVLRGQGGDDDLKGQGGNDRLVGGAGDDDLNGGGGTKDRCKQGPGEGILKRCELT